MRTAGPGDFEVEVAEAGTFVFGRRTMGDEITMSALQSRLLGPSFPMPKEGEDVPMPVFYARAYATIATLLVKSPGGWTPETLDPESEDSFIELEAVFVALRAKEKSFRVKPAPAGEVSST